MVHYFCRFLLAGIERIVTMTIHIGLSLSVAYGITMKRPLYILYAFLAHFFLNLPAAYIQYLPGGIWVMEGYIILFAIVAFLWIKKSKILFEGGELR